MKKQNREYFWQNSVADNSYKYLSQSLIKVIDKYKKKTHTFLLDIGCGNGFLTKHISKSFIKVIAIDSSSSGIKNAKKKYNGKIQFKKIDLFKYQSKKKPDFITIIEVIEHLYDPANLIKKIYKLSSKQTTILLTTPYHGFIKNLLIIILGKFDSHFDPLWLHGHIKFFTNITLRKLLIKNFRIIEKKYSGRFYPISKSVIYVLKKR